MTAAGGLRLATLLLALVGLISRLAPLADAGGRLLRQFSSEDGYLMLTMARNIALGNGMSIADGTVPTNGTQPLATLLYAAGFGLVGGDREAGVAVAQVLQILIGVAAALLLYRLGRRVFAGQPLARETAGFAAALWFAAPLTARHSMNNLETGLYALCVIAVALAVSAPTRPDARRSAFAQWAGLGALLGVSFWARNDAVLLCGAVGLAHLAAALPGSRAPLGRRIAELAVAAVATVAVASPWLVSNWMRFGSPMPVSGHAESMHVDFAENLHSAPVKLLEHLLLVLPLPSWLEAQAWVVAGSTVALVAAGAGVFLATRRVSPPVRAVAAVGGAFVFLLAAFYGLYFGAGHFMSRYMFPPSALFSLALVGAAAALAQRLPPQWAPWRPRLVGVMVVVALVLATGLNLRLYALGTQQGHFQVVEWVEAHVPDDVWVGAIQTGTLGFFHDRTINLDGKVNPAALEARREHRIPAYVVESPIQYLVDWVGIAGWIRKEPIDTHFELLVEDRERNLAVLARRSPAGSLGRSEELGP